MSYSQGRFKVIHSYQFMFKKKKMTTERKSSFLEKISWHLYSCYEIHPGSERWRPTCSDFHQFSVLLPGQVHVCQPCFHKLPKDHYCAFECKSPCQLVTDLNICLSEDQNSVMLFFSKCFIVKSLANSVIFFSRNVWLKWSVCWKTILQNQRRL